MASEVKVVHNHVDGAWRTPRTDRYVDVLNPATAGVLAHVPLTSAAEVDEAVQCGRADGRLSVQRLEREFYGDLHGQRRHGVEFYTETKVVVERWPREWSRKF